MIFKAKQSESQPKYPGLPEATDGSGAVVAMETAASEAAGAYPITPSTQMGEGWAQAVASGATNVHGRRLLFFEPEGEHAAAAVTAGMSMTGLRSANFSSGQGIAYMHESLYAAVGKRLTYVLNVAARAMTKHSLNVHAGHDDYHCVDDTGFFQLFAKNVQESADLNLIAHRVAELSLNPGLVAQDGFLTSHVIEDVLLPEPDLIREFLGDPADRIDTPTPAQRLVYGPTRRRIPELFDYDYPAMLGVVQNQDAYAQGIAAQRPFYFDHVAELTERAMREFAELTGRAYARASGYRMDDAEYVIAGQGSVVWNAEAVADHLRETRDLKVGVLNLTMFRPFPADLVATLLRGRKGVVVLERTDQPLAVDPPLMREIRAALSQAVENGRARAGRDVPPRMLAYRAVTAMEPRPLPFPALPALEPADVPDLYSGGFGFGSRDLQPGDLVAAVDNMLPAGPQRRQFYLGVDFIRRGTRLPKLEIWQQQILEAYPDIERLTLPPAKDVDLKPAGAIALRMHSVGGWGAITTGKNLALTAYELAGLHVKANPKYGSEKKGQPTTFYATLSPEPVRVNAELKHVDVVLSPDPNVFRHSNPLAGLSRGGVFVIQTDLTPEALWASLPETAREDVLERGIRVYALDGFAIAAGEASDAELRYRMQGAAFMGAFFRASAFMQQQGLGEQEVFDGIRAQLQKKFGKLGDQVVADNVRVIRRGYDELKEVPCTPTTGAAVVSDSPAVAPMPSLLRSDEADLGLANPGRFYEQVCAVCAVGQDVIADPFSAVATMPAVSASVRDMTGIRFEVPDFVAEKCTGCSQCWVQCPDAAIPGLVVSVEDVIDRAIARAKTTGSVDRVKQVQKHIAKECRAVLESAPFETFGGVAQLAFANVAGRLKWDPAKRADLDAEWTRVHDTLAAFPLAKTVPFFDLPERKEKGSGGLLAITVNPEACKGCNICVDVCPEGALVTVRQDEDVVERLRDNWSFWETLPDTDDRFINVRDMDEGIGVLSSLLLKKAAYRSMSGGDGACMGCGEKTVAHLVTSTIEAFMQPRVARFVARLDDLVAGLDEKVKGLVDVEAGATAAHGHAQAHAHGGTLPLKAGTEAEAERYFAAKRRVLDLKWRYESGPSGKGRAPLGIANSTGCSSVWASTWPFNPYPFPWVNHLFQDSPSIAIGIFEGHMRKMADDLAAVRRAEAMVAGTYDAARDEATLASFDWRSFTDDEFELCPPIMAVGGDGAMLDIGFQNLSRLLASGKPIRVMVLDTQVYSNTGGQACTSGYTGQVADMSAWGKAQHGKQETRKELSLIAIAHRGAYVLQSSQANPAHLIAGVIKGLKMRGPALFNLYTPCPVEHGLPDEWAPHAARLALESRAFPLIRFDPSLGDSLSECLSLEGNPALNDTWPSYTLEYVDDEGNAASMELPLTTADWAATEGRFRKHFKDVKRDKWTDDMTPFHELVALPVAERAGKQPFVWAKAKDGRLTRLAVTDDIVRLADDRLLFWSQLRELAGVAQPQWLRERMASDVAAAVDAQLMEARAEFERKLAEIRGTYPAMLARRMAEGLLRGAGPSATIADLLGIVERTRGLEPIGPIEVVLAPSGNGHAAVGAGDGTNGSFAAATIIPPMSAVPATAAPSATSVADALDVEAYIDTERCTSCNECTNLNNRLFAYNADKQAYIKDAKAGTFAELVQAAEKCPAGIIHPGSPLNPNERDLAKWVARAEPFN